MPITPKPITPKTSNLVLLENALKRVRSFNTGSLSIISEEGSDTTIEETQKTMIERIIEIVKEIGFLNKETFLSLELADFSLMPNYGISVIRLKKPVMWGIDPAGCIFLACKYIAKNTLTNVKKYQSFIISQPYNTSGSMIPMGPKRKLHLSPSDKNFLSAFEKLLKGEPLDQSKIELVTERETMSEKPLEEKIQTIFKYTFRLAIEEDASLRPGQ